MVAKIFHVACRAQLDDYRKWYQPKLSTTYQLKKLIGESGVLDGIREGDKVALKVHFGIRGTTRTLRSVFMRTVAEETRKRGGIPFFTETCGLGMGNDRNHAPGRIRIATENGYTTETLGAPIVIADGLLGNEGVRVEVSGKKLKEVWVAEAILQADRVVMLTHFTGHNTGCFAGALKNVGVGCISKRSKYELHVTAPPSINEKCDDCGWCVDVCPAGAISIPERKIDLDRCWRCGGCLDCPQDAINPEWTGTEELNQGIIDNALGVLELVGRKKFSYINFLLDITPHCDCVPYSDTSVVADQGILAGFDPLAMDRASLDMVNAAVGVHGSLVPQTALDAGKGKLDSIHSQTSCRYQLDMAVENGLGELEYELVEV